MLKNRATLRKASSEREPVGLVTDITATPALPTEQTQTQVSEGEQTAAQPVSADSAISPDMVVKELPRKNTTTRKTVENAAKTTTKKQSNTRSLDETAEALANRDLSKKEDNNSDNTSAGDSQVAETPQFSQLANTNQNSKPVGKALRSPHTAANSARTKAKAKGAGATSEDSQPQSKLPSQQASQAPQEKKPHQPRQSAPRQGMPKQGTQRKPTAKSLTAPAVQPGVKPARPARPTKSANSTSSANLVNNQKKTAPSRTKRPKGPSIRIIPLGGLNEIGKNITLYECEGDMFLVDCGLSFPSADMPGVDLVIPDFSYLEKNADRIKGLVITHGHEDHIGSIPYLLKKLDVPIYASPLALGLIKGKLKEHGLLSRAKLIQVAPRQTIKMGCMTVEFLRVNHSIPDAMSVVTHSPAGVIIQTGDFKIDYTPIEGDIIDLARFAELGSKGVLCLLSDSTNAERPGATMSERKVGQAFHTLFNNAEGKRIIIASFASNIHRIQQIINTAERYGRKVAVSGRSMENVVGVAIELGYLTVPKDILVEIDQISRLPHDKTIIITTGSQGEPMSALSRMAAGEHRKVNVTSEDFIIISATPIPGNEKHVTRVVNDLLKLGADVVYEAMYEVHVSGHACQDELRTMLAITKPTFFMPVHGEYKHLKAHAKLAKEQRIPPANIHIGDIGQVIEFTPDSMAVIGAVEAGQVFVDGLGVGDVGAIVIRDRKHLAEDGLIVVVMTMESASGALLSGPDIVSRGFVYVREAEALIEEARQVVKNILDKCASEHIRDWTTIKTSVRDGLSGYIYKKTKRSPMILPIITEV